MVKRTLAVNYFHKTLHLRYLTEAWIHLWNFCWNINSVHIFFTRFRNLSKNVEVLYETFKHSLSYYKASIWIFGNIETGDERVLVAYLEYIL